MADEYTQDMQWSNVDGVAVVEVLSREIVGPEAAQAFGAPIAALVKDGHTRVLLNFGRTKFMSSTVFGTLLNLCKQVNAARGELRICGMDPGVRFGADIIGLGRYIALHDDEASALAAFAREKTPAPG